MMGQPQPPQSLTGGGDGADVALEALLLLPEVVASSSLLIRKSKAPKMSRRRSSCSCAVSFVLLELLPASSSRLLAINTLTLTHERRSLTQR